MKQKKTLRTHHRGIPQDPGPLVCLLPPPHISEILNRCPHVMFRDFGLLLAEKREIPVYFIHSKETELLMVA
jgi:hypothetical protein